MASPKFPPEIQSRLSLIVDPAEKKRIDMRVRRMLETHSPEQVIAKHLAHLRLSEIQENKVPHHDDTVVELEHKVPQFQNVEVTGLAFLTKSMDPREADFEWVVPKKKTPAAAKEQVSIHADTGRQLLKAVPNQFSTRLEHKAPHQEIEVVEHAENDFEESIGSQMLEHKAPQEFMTGTDGVGGKVIQLFPFLKRPGVRSVAGVVSGSDRSVTAQPLPKSKAPDEKVMPVSGDGWRWHKLPYYLLSIACGWYLIQSLAQSLGGGMGGWVIAAAFDGTPILLAGARIRNTKNRQTALAGAILIWLAGLVIYLAPHAQMLTNEWTAYETARQNYQTSLHDFQFASANQKSLTETAKAKYDNAFSDIETVKRKYGEDSWRLGSAKAKADKAHAEWKTQSGAGSKLVAPTVPQLSDALRTAIQELMVRAGVFLAAFLLMFAMRIMDDEPTR